MRVSTSFIANVKTAEESSFKIKQNFAFYAYNLVCLYDSTCYEWIQHMEELWVISELTFSSQPQQMPSDRWQDACRRKRTYNTTKATYQPAGCWKLLLGDLLWAHNIFWGFSLLCSIAVINGFGCSPSLCLNNFSLNGLLSAEHMIPGFV